MNGFMLNPLIGYKVGRVDQAETALGAEMRLAADKSTGKKKPTQDKADKIVRRFVPDGLRLRYTK
jgi:hypothetical protein